MLVVWKLDRLARSLHDLVVIAANLKGRGVGLKILTGEGAAVDTTHPQGLARGGKAPGRPSNVNDLALATALGGRVHPRTRNIAETVIGTSLQRRVQTWWATVQVAMAAPA